MLLQPLRDKTLPQTPRMADKDSRYKHLGERTRRHHGNPAPESPPLAPKVRGVQTEAIDADPDPALVSDTYTTAHFRKAPTVGDGAGELFITDSRPRPAHV